MSTIEGKRLVTISVTKALDSSDGAYAAEDVLSESKTAGTYWTFSSPAKVSGGTGYIVKAQAISETNNITPRLTLYLFNAAPTSAVNDNIANTAVLHADISQYIGKIDFNAMEDLGPAGTDSTAITTPSTYGNLPLAFNCATSTNVLYGILVTRNAFTNTATNDMTIKLMCEQY